jgi:hypothetical protein
MHKLMRKLLILTTLCLILVATPTSNLKAKAMASACADSQNAVTFAKIEAAVICSWTSGEACQDAKDEIFSAQLRMIAACYATSSVT